MSNYSTVVLIVVIAGLNAHFFARIFVLGLFYYGLRTRATIEVCVFCVFFTLNCPSFVPVGIQNTQCLCQFVILKRYLVPGTSYYVVAKLRQHRYTYAYAALQ